MVNRLDYQFAESIQTHQPDFGEELGELCLGFARTAFGHHEISANRSYKSDYTDKKVSCNVLAIFAFLLTLPLSGLMTVIGTISLAASNSHSEKFAAYIAEINSKKTQ